MSTKERKLMTHIEQAPNVQTPVHEKAHQNGITKRIFAVATLMSASLGFGVSDSVEANSGEPIPASSSICVDSDKGIAGDTAIVNITNTDVAAGGWGALRASDEIAVYKRPPADQYSSVNFGPSEPPNPNLAVVEVGSDGQYCYDQGPARTNVILDEVGILSPTAVDASDPVRVLDTRNLVVNLPKNGISLVETRGNNPLSIDKLRFECYTYPALIGDSYFARFETFEISDLSPDTTPTNGNIDGSIVELKFVREDPPDAPFTIVHSLIADENGIGYKDSYIPTMFSSSETASRMLGFITLEHYPPYTITQTEYIPDTTVLYVNIPCIQGQPPA